MRAIYCLIFLIAAFGSNLSAQVQLFAPTKVYNTAPGWYETHKCYVQTKKIWADSTQGYTSYAWSDGSTSPHTNVPYGQVQVWDTLKLVVGLQGGGLDSSYFILRPATDPGSYVHTCIPPDFALCPGPCEFTLLEAFDDSTVIWSNGNVGTTGSPGCPVTNYNLTPTTVVSFTRYQYEGCVYNGSSFLFSVLHDSIAPTITANGNVLTASHLDYPLQWQAKDFIWYDGNQNQVGTGVNFTVTNSGSYTVVMEVEAPNDFIDIGGCAAGTFHPCSTVASAPFLIVGTSEPDPAPKPFIYPNPALDVIHLENAPDVKEVEIWNTLGQMLGRLRSDDQTYSLAHLPAGRYWLRFETKQGLQSLIVEKH